MRQLQGGDRVRAGVKVLGEGDWDQGGEDGGGLRVRGVAAPGAAGGGGGRRQPGVTAGVGEGWVQERSDFEEVLSSQREVQRCCHL